MENYIQSLGIYKHHFGKENEIENFEEAIDRFQRFLHISPSFLKNNQVDLAYTYFHLGLVYTKLDKNDPMENYIQSLGIYKHHFGKENAFVKNFMNNMELYFLMLIIKL